jgi:hypothetical protein
LKNSHPPLLEAPDICRSTLLDHGRMYGSTADSELMPGNSFNIDDLLNFSNEEIAGPIGENDGTHYWANDRTANSDFLFYGNSFPNADYYFHASDFFVPVS